MKNTVLTLTAITLAGFSAPAMAGTVQSEVRFGDPRNGRALDSTEFSIDYTAPLGSLLTYGTELTVKQKENAGAIDSRVAVRVGPALPDVAGFRSETFVELGRNLSVGNDSNFWGAGFKTTHNVIGGVTATVGYRHREGFKAVNYLENRLQGGLGLKLTNADKVVVNYYRHTGTERHDSVAVGITHIF